MQQNALRKVSVPQLDTKNDKTPVYVESPVTWTIYFCSQMKQEFEGVHEISVLWERRRATLTQYEARVRSGEENLSHPFHAKNARGRNAALISKLSNRELKAVYRLGLAK